MAFEWYIFFFSPCCLWPSLVWISRWRVGAQNSCTSKILSTPNDSLSLWRNPLVRGFSLTTTVPSAHFGMLLPGWECLQCSAHRIYIMTEHVWQRAVHPPTMGCVRKKIRPNNAGGKKKRPSRCLKRKWRSVKTETHPLIQKANVKESNLNSTALPGSLLINCFNAFLTQWGQGQWSKIIDSLYTICDIFWLNDWMMRRERRVV